MNVELDHIVLAARTLDEGVDYVHDALHLSVSSGGTHAGIGTHNKLVPLLRRRYLEIIAIDPEAPPPARPRWFGLDQPAVQAALATGPKLVAYVVRCPEFPTLGAPFPPLAPESAQRGAFRWRFGFTADASRPGNGALPYFIVWEPDSAHPCDSLPAARFDLTQIAVASPAAHTFQTAMTPLQLADVVFTAASDCAVSATFRSEHHTVTFSSL